MQLALGIIGLLVISYAIWIKNETRQDALFIVGGAFLLFYSIFLNDPIFITLQSVFIISALVELLKIRRKK